MTFRALNSSDEHRLFDYFHHLSPLTKSRYGPHPFDWETILALCKGAYQDFKCFVMVSSEDAIIAYSVIKKGYFHFDLSRYLKYELSIDHERDYTLAPSVADAHQSKGVGSLMMSLLFQELTQVKANRVVLWGGVQAANEQAIAFYEKHGFVTMGSFQKHGRNYDMIKEF